MISVIIAAYNEENRIKSSLHKIDRYLSEGGSDYEIIVVDDGSSDKTAQLVSEMGADIANLRLVRYETNMGKGHALRTGVLASRGDYVLLSDADLSTPIEEMSRLLQLVSHDRCDITIGSRALAMSRIIRKQPWWRRGMGKIFNRIVRLVIMDDFRDTQCGFKLFTGNAARELFGAARINRFAFDVEILALARKQGYRIAEVPVRWKNAPGSKVNPVFDSLQMLYDLCRIRFFLGSAKHCAASQKPAPEVPFPPGIRFPSLDKKLHH
ncbi:MAG: glycosyltransferase family 2 protein [Geobacter sp.]|nr:glycosyltransferase family 2 protein [Geobacter sp.]